MDQRQQQIVREMSRNSVPFQVVKYILLILNISIVTTTAIVTIIVCLLPTIIYEKKLSVESALNFIETGNLIPEKHRKQASFPNGYSEEQKANLVQLTAQEVDTIRFIRYLILGLSAVIILNQTLAVYGLFRERSCYILLSSTFIGLVGQLSLFVLPAPIFLLIVLYLVFSISYVILINHLDSKAKNLSLSNGRSSVSRMSSLEPQMCGASKVCCCRCKGCLCTPTSLAPPAMTATINPNRKTSMPYMAPVSALHPNPSVPYYYGSLGRKSRESRLYLSQLQAAAAAKPDISSDIYGHRIDPRQVNPASTSLKTSNKFTNLGMDNFKSPYSTVRRDSSGYNYANLERLNNSTMI